MNDVTWEQTERRETDKAHEKVLSAHAGAAYTQRLSRQQAGKTPFRGPFDSRC